METEKGKETEGERGQIEGGEESRRVAEREED